LSNNELALALTPLIEAFERFDIRYYIGGSVASSARGLPRTTLDVDLVADLTPAHIEPLVTTLTDKYYIDADMIRDALQRKASFNIIHLDTMLKIDVFILKDQAHDQSAFQRASSGLLAPDQGGFPAVISASEDVVLHKLYWYRLGGETSERQWNDVLGVLQVQGQTLDMDYMQQWAEKLKLTDLLQRVLLEADIEGEE
jgi:hypothetical protein